MARPSCRAAVRTAWRGVPWLAIAVVVVTSVMWGRHLQRQQPKIFLGAAPLVGRNELDGWEWRFGWGLVGAATIGTTVTLAVWRGWFSVLRIRWVLLATGFGAAAYGVVLALTDGVDGVLYGATHQTEYLANLTKAPPAGEFVRNFVDDIDRYTVHQRGHPPGFVLVLKFLDSIGLDGGWPTASLSILATAAMPVGVLIAVWAIAGHEWVRFSAPWLVVAPYALWMITSADAVFAAVAAWSVATCALGLRSTRWRAAGWGALSGLLYGSLLFLTYGGAIFVLLPLSLIFAKRREGGALATSLAAVVVTGAVTLAFARAGFWWFDGAYETRRQYWAGTAKLRPWEYFLLANLAVTLIVIGPATCAAIIHRSRHLFGRPGPLPSIRILIIGASIALMAAHLSQMSKAETERIWLLFFPWLVIAAGVFLDSADRHPDRPNDRRVAVAAVAAQVAAGVMLQAALVSKW